MKAVHLAFGTAAKACPWCTKKISQLTNARIVAPDFDPDVELPLPTVPQRREHAAAHAEALQAWIVRVRPDPERRPATITINVDDFERSRLDFATSLTAGASAACSWGVRSDQETTAVAVVVAVVVAVAVAVAVAGTGAPTLTSVAFKLMGKPTTTTPPAAPAADSDDAPRPPLSAGTSVGFNGNIHAATQPAASAMLANVAWFKRLGDSLHFCDALGDHTPNGKRADSVCEVLLTACAHLACPSRRQEEAGRPVLDLRRRKHVPGGGLARSGWHAEARRVRRVIGRVPAPPADRPVASGVERPGWPRRHTCVLGKGAGQVGAT